MPSDAMTRREPSAARKPALAALAILLTAVMAAPARADDFYTPPATLPAANGDVIRAEHSAFYLDPLRTVRAPATVHRVMYRSTDAHGAPIAATGAVLTPTKPWSGHGRRPVVGYAVGTQGLGDQCAPCRASSRPARSTRAPSRRPSAGSRRGSPACLRSAPAAGSDRNP
jgi:hypothetical protein